MSSDAVAHRLETALEHAVRNGQISLDSEKLGEVGRVITQGIVVDTLSEDGLLDIKFEADGQPSIVRYDLKQIFIGVSVLIPAISPGWSAAYLTLIGLWALSATRTPLSRSSSMLVWILKCEHQERCPSSELECRFNEAHKTQFGEEAPEGDYAANCLSLENMGVFKRDGIDVVIAEYCFVTKE